MFSDLKHDNQENYTSHMIDRIHIFSSIKSDHSLKMYDKRLLRLQITDYVQIMCTNFHDNTAII